MKIYVKDVYKQTNKVSTQCIHTKQCTYKKTEHFDSEQSNEIAHNANGMKT